MHLFLLQLRVLRLTGGDESASASQNSVIQLRLANRFITYRHLEGRW